ncbi:MAG: hypothetical protein HOQ24_14175 [Mycobacteriaceae bacterium]|nr:hypothetical protein [Mycobacteriaceae bacterium]
MSRPTPWQIAPRAAESNGRGLSKTLAGKGWSAFRSAVRGHEGYVLAAAADVATFCLLFRPWLTITGVDGTARSDAFGTVEADTMYMMAWSHGGPPTANISATWAILAAGAIALTVAAVAVNLRRGSRALARAAAVSSMAVPVFVLLAMRHLSDKGREMYDMTGRGWDSGGQIGSWIQWAVGKGDLLVPGVRSSAYATASLTWVAILACIASIAGAVVTTAEGLRGGSQWRAPILRIVGRRRRYLLPE